MALINCAECGREVSDKAMACPHCGNPINQQSRQSEEYLCCPKCNSRELHAEHNGFSGGKALTGALLVGGIGLLAGTIGSKDLQITCLKCGNKFKAGEAKVVKNISVISDDEAEIVEVIKSQGLIGATKWYKDKKNCGLAEAKKVVDEIRDKYEISPSAKDVNSSGKGCSVILLIGLVLTIGMITLFL